MACAAIKFKTAIDQQIVWRRTRFAPGFLCQPHSIQLHAGILSRLAKLQLVAALPALHIQFELLPLLISGRDASHLLIIEIHIKGPARGLGVRLAGVKTQLIDLAGLHFNRLRDPLPQRAVAVEIQRIIAALGRAGGGGLYQLDLLVGAVAGPGVDGLQAGGRARRQRIGVKVAVFKRQNLAQLDIIQ